MGPILSKFNCRNVGYVRVHSFNSIHAIALSMLYQDPRVQFSEIKKMPLLCVLYIAYTTLVLELAIHYSEFFEWHIWSSLWHRCCYRKRCTRVSNSSSGLRLHKHALVEFRCLHNWPMKTAHTHTHSISTYRTSLCLPMHAQLFSMQNALRLTIARLYQQNLYFVFWLGVLCFVAECVCELDRIFIKF